MTKLAALSYRAPLDEYEHEAAALFEELKSGADAAAWRFKWMHPRFRGQSIDDVRSATLDLASAGDSPGRGGII